ncbi:MAG: preprotein translocase subunit SecA [Planctomycetota bacterium]|nr:MAG: preprotein translocase subunit SecA [Planctomycetota bacterium]
MEQLLEKIWESLGAAASGVLQAFERTITNVFGSSNARMVKRMQSRVDAITALEPQYEAMSNEELEEQTAIFRRRLAEGETLDDLLTEAFAVCREAGKRYLGMRHYDVQLIGGMILHSGAIAEMVTGEGKTLVATLPTYLNALSGSVHVITVNDYLARRDMEWMGPLYMGLGLTVGAIQSGMDPAARQRAYACDITYGTNNEFGFDYLRDNMKMAARGDDRFAKHQQQVQGPLNFALIDEVDNILIDEARTPLIISGPAYDNPRKYAEADRVARQLKRDEHFSVKEKEHSAHLTDEGVREAERLVGVESFYTAGNMEWPHLIDNSLKAHHLYKRDVNYVVKEGQVIIVDEFTGRLMEGRQWSDGLHQAVEAKEGVKIKEETQTLATITLQNFFKLYKKLGGMTGTALTEAGEFWKIYKLDVVAIPTNRPLQRIESPDVIYRSEKEKYVAIADEIERLNKWDTLELSDGSEVIGSIKGEQNGHLEFTPKGSTKPQRVAKDEVVAIQERGRPILIGTVSIEKSERLADLLQKRGIKHEVLNAKQHKREAEIVAQAGRRGAVTIATNMAGRGTDIVLGGNAETMAWAVLQDRYETRLDVPREEWDALVDKIRSEEKMDVEGETVRDLGGLHIIGTERHEARRIDLQLRGRSGRQGDPGSSRFYLSLEDDLMRIFAGEWVKNVLTRLGMKEGEAIESKMVSRRIEAAQKKVEERNFEARKNLLEYDEVMDEQRKRVYRYRQDILDGVNCKTLILEMIDSQVRQNLTTILRPEFGGESFAAFAGKALGAEFDARDFTNTDFRTAEEHAKNEAERIAEGQVLDAVEENLPEEEEPKEWKWEALAKTANARWNLSLRDRELKKIGRDAVTDLLIEKARESIQKIDLSDGAPYLEEDFSLLTMVGWVRNKFGLQLDLDECRGLEQEELETKIIDEASAAYSQREIEFPVMAGLLHYTVSDAGGQKRYDRERLVTWAHERFGAEISLDDLKRRQRDEIRDLLLDRSRENYARSQSVAKQMQNRIESLFPPGTETADVPERKREELAVWARDSIDAELTAERLAEMDREAVETELAAALQDRFCPEIRRMERALVLQLLDMAWKDHLLAMDHLRSSIGLRGYAQVDPKVEYKREGMRTFEEMWQSIFERVTDLVFRMEQLDEQFVSSTWVESAAVHEEAQSVRDMAAEGGGQDESYDGSEQKKLEPIRNREQRVGRNAPCPCGSGKKYKNCCLRKMAG